MKHRLIECCSKIGSGITPKGGDSVYVAAGVPLIRSQNVLDGAFSAEGLRYITAEQHDRMSGSKVYPDDILFNITGASIGRCCLLPAEMEEANVNQHVCIVRLKGGFHAPFFAYVLSSKVAKRALHESQAGGGREGLNFKNLGDFKIYAPPLPEQKAIASVLQCWDNGISQLEAKIAAKERVKKGLMQQLLSGQLRLSRFGEAGKWDKDECQMPDGWRKMKLSQISNLTAGGTPSKTRPEYWGGEIPWMSSGDLNKKIVSEVSGRITELGLKKSSTKFIPKYSVLIGLAGQGKTRGTVAVNNFELCTNQSVAAIIPDSSKAHYYFIYQNLEIRYDELRQLSAGDGGRGGLNLTLLGNLPIVLPSLEEQKAIVRVLSAADRELDALRRKLEVWKVQKKYLLNNLVDGSIRLPEFVDTEKEVAG
ncbi:MAG: restriction endonuclease subunit S [Opitutales bacterium]